MKKCVKCGTQKPLSEYHVENSRPDGTKGVCKQCVRSGEVERYFWKTRDPESYNEYHYNRKQYFTEKFPDQSYSSFTSYIKRKCDFKLSDLTREDMDREVNYYLTIKRAY